MNENSFTTFKGFLNNEHYSYNKSVPEENHEQNLTHFKYQRQDYRTILKCAYCDKVFRSIGDKEQKNTLTYHVFNKHPYIPTGAECWEKGAECSRKEIMVENKDYVKIIIDGSYIQARREKCKTETTVLRPKLQNIDLDSKPARISNVIDEFVEIDTLKELVELKDVEKHRTNKCHIRNCEKCQLARQKRLLVREMGRLKNYKNPKFLTLTEIGHTLEPAYRKKVELDFKRAVRLYRFQLRNHPEYFLKPGVRHTKTALKNIRNYKVQYVATVEQKGDYWHVHALIDMPFIDNRYYDRESPVGKLTQLQELWYNAVGDGSHVADISQIKNEVRSSMEKNKLFQELAAKHGKGLVGATWYVTKYVSKVLHMDNEAYAVNIYSKHLYLTSNDRETLEVKVEGQEKSLQLHVTSLDIYRTKVNQKHYKEYNIRGHRYRLVWVFSGTVEGNAKRRLENDKKWGVT